MTSLNKNLMSVNILIINALDKEKKLLFDLLSKLDKKNSGRKL